jgi:toxin ParE1/3/4
VRYRVTFRPLADEDLVNIYSYIADKNPLSAITLIRKVRAQCITLETMALRGPLRERLGSGMRLLVIDRKIMVAYRISADEVEITRVFYAGQNIPDRLGED